MYSLYDILRYKYCITLISYTDTNRQDPSPSGLCSPSCNIIARASCYQGFTYKVLQTPSVYLISLVLICSIRIVYLQNIGSVYLGFFPKKNTSHLWSSKNLLLFFARPFIHTHYPINSILKAFQPIVSYYRKKQTK